MATYLKNSSAFTLAELLIITSLLIVVYFLISGTNFQTQFAKARDLKRKEALSKMQKVLEEFHGDFNRYPKVEEIAYEEMSDSSAAGKVCGSIKTDEKLSNYMPELPCAPGSSGGDYVYFVYDNYQKYALFTTLENTADPAIEAVGCDYGCSYFKNVKNIANSISSNYFNYYAGSSDFMAQPCFGRVNLTYCYPNAKYYWQRCQVGAYPGYSQIYCTPAWCESLCGK